MICDNTLLENMGAPFASSSKMICSKMLRVKSSLDLASTTVNTSLSNTSCLTSVKVM